MKLKGGGIQNKDTIVIYSGRFQPFHKGHHDVYRFLKERYENVFIVTTDTKSKDKKRYPFNFSQKVDIMKTLGRVEEHDIYPEPVSNPYSDYYIIRHIRYLKSISDSLPKEIERRITNIDLKNALVLFAISDKDMIPTDGTTPRFVFPNNNLLYTKKLNNKGNPVPAKIQKIKSRKHFRNTKFNNINSATNKKFNYILTVPTNVFNVLGENINSATQLRNMIISPPEGYTSLNVLEALYDLKSNSSNEKLLQFIIKTIKKAYGIRTPGTASASTNQLLSASTRRNSNSALSPTTLVSIKPIQKKSLKNSTKRRQNSKKKNMTNIIPRRSARLRKNISN